MQIGSYKGAASVYKPAKIQTPQTSQLASEPKLVRPKTQLTTQQTSISSNSRTGMADKMTSTLTQSSYLTNQNSSLNTQNVDFVHEAKKQSVPLADTKGAGGPQVAPDPIQQLQKTQNLQALSILKTGS